MTPQRMALAHEWLESRTGSEKVFEALAANFPEADLYALTNTLHERFESGGRPIQTTFLDRTPVIRRRRDLALPLMPLAWRTASREKYDLVITSSHACVKGFRPAREARHLCYCYTPMRYVWESHDKRGGLGNVASLGPRRLMRQWDYRSVAWVDSFAAISTAVQTRIRDCYGRSSHVIHPPVDTNFFTPETSTIADGHDDGLPAEPFALAASRFIPYKRVDLAILAAERAGIPLVVAGAGPLEAQLRALARGVNVPVTFEISPTDERLRTLYRRASVFVFPALEDFGIVAVEAQACGTPVVGLRTGGSADTVVHHVTGVLVETQTVDDFAVAIHRAVALPCHAACVSNASLYSQEVFRNRIDTWVQAEARSPSL